MATQTDAEKSASLVGTVTWIEIPATDLTRVQAFYSSVFGWNYPASSAPTDPNCAAEPQYVIFNKGITNGGFCKVSPENFLSPALHPDNPEKVRTSVRVTLNVESVDETLIAIEKAGGSVYVPKREIPNNMGVVAFFLDTEKNVMGVWSAK